MQHKTIWIKICFFYALLPHALAIDCYQCTSLDHGVKECDDTFVTDITTENFISRDCYFGYWKAKFCTKLKGTREDGTSVVVRQCIVEDWGSHCGLIKFEVDNRIQNIEGCLETCNFDGCNLATMNNYSQLAVWIPVLVSFLAGRVL